MADDTRTVYALTLGEYSDYRVDAIYESRGDAERECERIAAQTRESVRVEPFDWYPASGPPLGMEVKRDAD